MEKKLNVPFITEIIFNFALIAKVVAHNYKIIAKWAHVGKLQKQRL